ncbi:F0F1 ATP synthase subunit gamma [Entomoplasma ellychniae]|uniref:ATP synthase gamma chain n=1 Tax=Entomoplasma ellychniae TaxID=2114 RepID=A0A8E2UAZ1_9MOLU|nr:ATP synthase F1 subunit gamma [Entomoplasma ellychniae]PPE04890.1 F0F1 ATP synthase subunit gamma [Entomoplasma ellychniae]
MPNLSALKNDILSIKNTGKITNAMQLVASAKLRKIGKKVLDVQEYMDDVYRVFSDIISNSSTESKFLKNEEIEIKKTLWVVINSNLGLCGGYNNNVNKLVINGFKPEDEVYTIGTKAISTYSSRKMKIKKSITNVDIDFTNSQAKEIGNDILAYYSSGEFNDVCIVYTKFINNVTFEPRILKIFPIIKSKVIQTESKKVNYTFEPSAGEVFDSAVNIYLSTMVYGCIIESQVSEQASRRVSMENATNNGKELSFNLSIKYNRERQASITQEISEIVSGASALQD